MRLIGGVPYRFPVASDVALAGASWCGGIEDFGRLTTRGVKLIGAPGVDADSTVAPAQGRRYSRAIAGASLKFRPRFVPIVALARYSWKRTPEGALDRECWRDT